MKIKKPKRIMSLFLAALMCVTSLVGIGTTAYAAEETDDVYLISYPRDGDSNYNAEWGHSTYSEWCSFNSYVGWLQHCDSFRLYQKYVEPNVEYMHNYYLKEVKGNAEICKRKNYSGERKAS